MGKYGKEHLVVNSDKNAVSEVADLNSQDVSGISDSNSVVDDNAVQETAKQGSILGVPMMHMLCAAVAAIGILAAILLVGGLLNKKNKNNNPEEWVNYKYEVVKNNSQSYFHTTGSLYKVVRVKGEGWVKDILTRLLNGNFDNSDVGYIKKLDSDIILSCITMPNGINEITKVRNAFTNLVQAVNNKSISNKEAFDTFNAAMGNKKAPEITSQKIYYNL